MNQPFEPLAARSSVRTLVASKVRELVNEGLGNPDVLPFWVGEPDEPTPEFIRKAGAQAIEACDTFYTHNLGIPPLREELARYITRLHRPTSSDNIAVTSAGVNALMLVSQLLLDPGDRVVEVTPLWPNLVEIPRILSANVECVTLKFSNSGWALDLDELLAALKPGTRALYINSPNNPTGWTLSVAEQRTILDTAAGTGSGSLLTTPTSASITARTVRWPLRSSTSPTRGIAWSAPTSFRSPG